MTTSAAGRTVSALDNLNTSARQGRRPLARQIRATVSLPTPWRAAMTVRVDRVDQHTDPSSGTAATVSPTIAATVAAAIWGLDDPDLAPPGQHRPTPDSKNRSRQRRTVSWCAPNSRATDRTDSPPANANSAPAARTRRYGSTPDRANRSNAARSCTDNSNT